MAILTFRDIVLGFGHPPLLEGINFQIDRGERLCLIGRNGAGNSPLLKLLAGEIQPDSGEIIRGQGLRVAQLAQEVPLGTSGSIFHVVAEGLGKAGELIDRYHQLAHDVADDHSLMDALEECQHELENIDGWALTQRVDTVLTKLGLDPDNDIASLSGGMKRRVMLARALVSEPDLLLLDEPTNHLHIAAITWIEEFLLNWNGALLFITHDRAFLQRLATRIIELDRGKLADFPGDYATYLARKEAMLVDEEKHNALFDKRLAQEEVWIRQGIKARRTRNEGRVRALEAMRNEHAARRTRTGSVNMGIQSAERSGKIVVEAEGVGFDYDGRAIVRDLTSTNMRGDKIGIIGPNGSGKTTLLRLLLGELQPTRGQLQLGTKMQIAYFDQYRAVLDEEKTVVDNVGEGSDTVIINGQPKHVLSYLQDFLFAPQRARQPVKALSGGERNRLLLAKLFTKPSNLLVLDEPTNDLDADTLELLEELLIDYKGTVLLVSHDRAFLNNVVTSTLVFEGDGVVNEYVGGYDDWLRQRFTPASTKSNAKPAEAKPVPAAKEKAKKLSFKDQRELEAIPLKIQSLESEREQINTRMGDPGFFQQDKGLINTAQTRLAAIDKELLAAYARWEALEAQQT